MNNICFFTYTHSNCKDIWNPYFDSLEKYAKNIKSYVFSNVDSKDFANHKFIIYQDELNYCEEFVRGLKSIDEEYFIYMQEDFILYDFIDKKKIEYYKKILDKSKFSFVRLLKCGDVTETCILDDLYLISQINKPHNSINSFSMQPTLWKKKDFIKLYLNTKKHTFGEGWEYTKSMNELNINGLYAYNLESRRGGHFDSSVFPYIATAIVKGKWNYSEYNKELEHIFDAYKIDKNIRGTI
jgi:hypothetical protein